MYEDIVAKTNHLENQIEFEVFWKRLHLVKKFTFLAQSKDGWTRKGIGKVSVEAGKENSSLIFYEKGFWEDINGNSINFSNTFRWSILENVISLEHLRKGMSHPVFLLHLIPSGKNSLVSVEPHVCNKDIYTGNMDLNPDSLIFNWKVIGPKKNEEIIYTYLL